MTTLDMWDDMWCSLGRSERYYGPEPADFDPCSFDNITARLSAFSGRIDKDTALRAWASYVFVGPAYDQDGHTRSLENDDIRDRAPRAIAVLAHCKDPRAEVTRARVWLERHGHSWPVLRFSEFDAAIAALAYFRSDALKNIQTAWCVKRLTYLVNWDI